MLKRREVQVLRRPISGALPVLSPTRCTHGNAVSDHVPSN